MVANSILGEVVWYKNIGTGRQPRLAAAHGVAGGANITSPQLIAELRRRGLQFVTLTTEVERFLAGLREVVDQQRT